MRIHNPTSVAIRAAGLPTCAVLTELVGSPVSAAERDAWSK